MQKSLLIGLLLIFTLILSSCAMIAPSPTATQVPPTDTTFPTDTQQPTLPPTATLTLIPTETSTATITATQGPQFADFKITSALRNSNGSLSISFSIPNLKEAVNAIIGTQHYYCVVDAAYPERLFCTGPSVLTDTSLPLKFVSISGDITAYESTIEIAGSLVPTFIPGDPRTWCPDRGKNVNCETENRVRFKPPCIVSTCYDACGYYYSIDTCQNSTPNPEFTGG